MINRPTNYSSTRHLANSTLYKEQVRQTALADSYKTTNPFSSPLLAPVAIIVLIAIAFNIIASTPFYEGLILALS